MILKVNMRPFKDNYTYTFYMKSFALKLGNCFFTKIKCRQWAFFPISLDFGAGNRHLPTTTYFFSPELDKTFELQEVETTTFKLGCL